MIAADNYKQEILNSGPIVIKPSLHSNSRLIVHNSTNAPPTTGISFNQTINLPKLELLNQPTRFWHNRELETLGKGCPAIQVEGEPQRTPLQLKVIMTILIKIFFIQN